MARSKVVAERRLESRSSCPFPLRLRDGLLSDVLVAACWRRAWAWASSLSRWAAARASVTLEDGFGERCATMGNPLFLVAGSLPYRQEGKRQNVTVAKQDVAHSCRQDVACFARQDVAARLFAQKNIACLLPSSPPGCSQRASEVPAKRRCTLGSGRRGSNPRQPAWKAGTLPLSYSRSNFCVRLVCYRTGRGART